MKNRLNKRPNDSLSALLNLIPDPAIVVDATGKIIAANNLTEKYTGLKAKDLTGKKFTEESFLGKQQKTVLVKNLKKRLNGDIVSSYEVEIKGKNGPKTLELTGKRIEYEEKIYDLVTLHDVTVRSQNQKKLQRDLSQSELKFKNISDSTFDGIILFDNKQKIRYWNPAAERMFGYKANEVLGKALKETIIPKHAIRLTRKIKQDFAKYPNSVSRILEFPGRRKDGTEFPTEVSISWTQIGTETFFMANLRDITERRNVEHALKQQRDILEVVTQNAGIYVMLITKDYRIFWANEKMKEKHGYDIANKKCYVCLNNRADICPTCGVKKIFDGEKVVTREDSRFDLKGNPISAQVTVFPVKDKNGKVFAALEVIVPTTQRKLMETKIKEAEDLYHAMFEQTPLGVIVVDPETSTILQFNNNAHQQLGYTREEFSKIRISDFEALEKPEEISNRLKTTLNKGQTEFLTKLRTKNGEIRSVLVNQRVIQLSAKKLVLVTCHDVTGVNRLHEAVQSSEERFRAISNSVRDPLILVDEYARVTYWNPAAEYTFGYTSKEAMGKSIHELVLPASTCREIKDSVKQSVKIFRETVMGYFTVGNVELVGRRKDGTEFPAELSLSPMMLNGKWSAVGIVKDVTKRKNADQKLRDAEQRYHALFDQAPLGVLVVDPQTLQCVEFNSVAHTQLGYSREEFEKITVPDFQAEEKSEQTLERARKILQEGEGEFETKHRTKTGEIRNVIVSIKAFKSGGKPYLHCICHDITEAKKIQNALVESEARYRQLVEVAQEGIWAVDNECITTFVNPRMAQMLGYTEDEMIGKNLADFLDAKMKPTIIKIVKDFTQSSPKSQYEYAFPHKNAGNIDTTVSLAVITNDEKQKTGILAVVSDNTQRKKAEKALKESEELSRAIVANAPIGIATSDATYHFLSANEAFCNILGYSQEELRRLTFKDISDPQTIDSSVEKMTALEKGEITWFEQEKGYIRKDGTPIIGRVSVNAIRDQKGKPVLFVVELEDITKRKQLENDLKASEERFRAISTSAMDAIVLSDEDDKVIYWNPAAEKIFGYSANKALGRKVADLIIPAEYRDKHEKLQAKLNELKSMRRFGLTCVRSDGSLISIDLSLVPVKVKDNNCLLAVIRDITEWKAMEEALRRERDLLESVTASTNILLSIVDKDYRIIWGNQIAKGTKHGPNIEGRHCYEIFADNPNENCQGCGVKKVFENGESIARRDYHRKTNDGKDWWAELISTPIKDKNGKVVAALELAIEITERKQLQNKLAEYSQRLEEIVQQRTAQLKKTQAELVKSERLAAIGELAGMIGHDLRNPLTGIKNSTYYMKKKGEKIASTQAKEMLETIDKCVDYSNKIINDLLDYSREIHLSLEITSPRKLLHDSLAMVKIPRTIHVKNMLGESPVLPLDQDRIKRVFVNLLKNAVDAMPNGGTITVEGRLLKDALEISLADTGTGISEDILPKIFTPLFTTKAQGMGFGLAICKRIIEAHGGTITVKTAKGQGTTFTLTLPFKPKTENGGENVWINVPESSLLTMTKQ